MKLFINKLLNNEILNSYNFARNADIVFSETILKDNFKSKNSKKYNLIYEDDKKIFYVLNEFEISENQVIFCNTYMVNLLFEVLNVKSNLKNIKLITHQTDLPITEKLFRTKPDCISEWYSINVAYEHKNLHSIPLGLSNEYSPKNILKNHYKEKISENTNEKNDELYVNFQKNTNNKERGKLVKKLEKLDHVEVDEPKLSVNEYLEKLIKFKFIFSPHGNGIDTHRIWESIYAHSIPVTKKHPNFKTFNDLPIIQLEEYSDFNIKKCNKISETFDQSYFQSEKLTINYWMEVIRNTKLPSDENVYYFSRYDEKLNYHINKYHNSERLNSRLKKIMYNIRRIKNFLYSE